MHPPVRVACNVPVRVRLRQLQARRAHPQAVEGAVAALGRLQAPVARRAVGDQARCAALQLMLLLRVEEDMLNMRVSGIRCFLQAPGRNVQPKGSGSIILRALSQEENVQSWGFQGA